MDFLKLNDKQIYRQMQKPGVYKLRHLHRA